ncbi:WD40-repeat-containing domain protein [Globomyces pollinis-pini]|nr:WD40-repeat-containing domain protein [Globomyces pollinis-pini]
MTGICELKSFTSNTVVITNLGQEVNPGSIMLLNVNDAPPERNVPHIPLNCISRVFERNRRPVLCVAENSSIELTAYGSSGEFYVINWESPKKKQCFKIPQKTDVLSQSVLGPSGSSLLANGCRNGSIYLFDIRSQQCSTHFTTLNVRSPFTCVKPMDNDYTFVTSSLNGNIDVWDIRNSKHSLHTLASSNTIKPYRFDMYRNSIVSVSDDGWLRSWDAISGVLLIAKRLYDVVEERIFTSSHESDGQMGLCIAGKHGIDYLSCF